MYLLDTDILSNLLKKSPAARLIRLLAKIPIEYQFTSAITLGEMAYGAYRLPHGKELLNRILNSINPFQVLAFDYQSGLIYGKIRGSLEKKGVSLSEADLRIGSIALAHQMTVVTGNTKHFKKIPNLVVENWL